MGPPEDSTPAHSIPSSSKGGHGSSMPECTAQVQPKAAVTLPQLEKDRLAGFGKQTRSRSECPQWGSGWTLKDLTGLV